MDMEAALRARLLAAAPVATLVSERIYWEERPQTAAIPDVTLLLIVDNRPQHMGGFQNLKDATLQVDVRGRNFAEKKALKEAVIAALAPAHTGNGIHFEAATRIAARTLNERTSTQTIFRDAIDFQLHYRPA